MILRDRDPLLNEKIGEIKCPKSQIDFQQKKFQQQNNIAQLVESIQEHVQRIEVAHKKSLLNVEQKWQDALDG